MGARLAKTSLSGPVEGPPVRATAASPAQGQSGQNRQLLFGSPVCTPSGAAHRPSEPQSPRAIIATPPTPITLARILVMANSSDCPPIRKEIGGAIRLRSARPRLRASWPKQLPASGLTNIEGDGPTVFAHARKMGLEGIVSKRKDSMYRSGRSPDWLKMKNPAAPAVKREAEEHWGGERWR